MWGWILSIVLSLLRGRVKSMFTIWTLIPVILVFGVVVLVIGGLIYLARRQSELEPADSAGDLGSSATTDFVGQS